MYKLPVPILDSAKQTVCSTSFLDFVNFLVFPRETPEVEPVDEGPQEMTFEEYKKQLSESRKQPEFNLRKVDSDKKGLKQLKKPTEKDNESSSSFFFPKKVCSL